MTATDRKRPLLAAALALVSPGLGHLYLREWFRALLWFGVILSATQLLVPIQPPETLTVGGVMDAYGAVEMSTRAKAVIMGLTGLSMADAYWMATSGNRRAAAEDGDVCPACGKELDEELTFCHWCSADLADPTDDDRDRDGEDPA